MAITPAYFEPLAFDDHALLDSGDAWKFERYGELSLVRPDPQALWRPRLARGEWETADLVFERESDRGGTWRRGERCRRSTATPAEWTVAWSAGGVQSRFVCRPTPFKHVGLFPEQAVNWAWLAELAPTLARADGPPRLLNLFGYTGAASVVAAQAGYAVTHVDASRASLTWARENATASGLADDAWRSVLDDAPAFAQRERRRAARYEVVLLDPPHYGRGPKGEKWQLEEQLAALVETAHALLAERAVLVLSTYAIGCSPLALANLFGSLGAGADPAVGSRDGSSAGHSCMIEAGELVLREEPRDGLPTRLLPCGYGARYARGL